MNVSTSKIVANVITSCKDNDFTFKIKDISSYYNLLKFIPY